MHWEGQGPDYALSWAGLTWRLRLDGPSPGLELVGTGHANLLTLSGLAVRGRSCRWDLDRPTLAKWERLFDRIEATYLFPEWGGLSVRGSWNLVPDLEAVDLEVQILASSVDFLKAVEIQVISQFDDAEGSHSASASVVEDEYQVEPRDQESAALSYDGREPLEILQRLSTRSLPSGAGGGFVPKVMETPWLGGGLRYVEFVHPDDVSRRMERFPGSHKPAIEGASSSMAGRWTRYSIFGHDLEKGVLLRSRMRGFWSREAISSEELNSKCRDFRAEPLPLGP